MVYAQQRKSKLIDEATQDDMVSSRLLLTDADLSFLANGKGVTGHEESMDENGVPRRPALTMAPKKRRKVSADLADETDETDQTDHTDQTETEDDRVMSFTNTVVSEATVPTRRAPSSTSAATASMSPATQQSGPSAGATSSAVAFTRSAILATRAASSQIPSLRKKPTLRAGVSRTGLQKTVAKDRMARRKEEMALEKSIRLATLLF